MLKDRTPRKVITHRIAAGRPNNPTLPMGAEGKWVHALDYFEITGVEQDPKSLQFVVDRRAMDILPSLGKQYDPHKPRRIPIRLASDTLEDSLLQSYRSRAMLPVLSADGTQKMGQKDGEDPSPILRLQPWCEGDGVEARRLSSGGDRSVIPCHASPKCGDRQMPQLLDLLGKKVKHDPTSDVKRCPWSQNASVAGTRGAHPVAKKAPVCKPETVLIAHCDAVGSIGSFARFRSHGHYTADALRSSLEEIQRQLGFLAGVPLDLVMVMKRIGTPDGGPGKLQPIVHAELRVSPEETIKLMEHNLAARISIKESSRQLNAARVEAESEVIDAEFAQPLLAGKDGGGSLKG